ncbi:MAG: IS1182 family transposase [Ignavibacteria bacterium]|nr:IS1182 family transposase [Ignavibacteria bacterium]
MKKVFKKYQQDQISLLPESLEELISSTHLVRVVNETMERMDLQPLIDSYKGGGTSSYHPKMMMKILVYAYTEKIYSSRRIAKALRENVNFMWLSSKSRPDFRTINNFRSSRLKGLIDTVFSSTLEILIDSKLIKLEDYFTDGTKIEADANKYSYVWKKNVERNKSKLQIKIKEILNQIDKANEDEQKEYRDRDLEETGEESTISSEKIKEKVEEINRKLKEISDSKKIKETKVLKTKLEKDYLFKLQKYESHEKNLGGRNSYSKTDKDATFMKPKSNGFGNKELKPCYNIQMGTEGQYIVGYSVHQNASDTTAMISHLEKLKGILKKFTENREKKLPLNIIADAGYGSEENYEYLETEDINGYVKYNMYDIEKTKKYIENKFRTENLQYDKEKDEFICPAEKRLTYIKTVDIKTANGYNTQRRLYQSENCTGCKMRIQCHKSTENRIIQISHKLNEYRSKARELLNTEKGSQYKKKRNIEIESVFGDIKHNREFKRFKLRGIEKVNIETGIVSIAHNMIKWWKMKLGDGINMNLAVAS